jgi:hypothetical protein
MRGKLGMKLRIWSALLRHIRRRTNKVVQFPSWTIHIMLMVGVVRKALAKGKKCFIVSKDWLEDCLVPSKDKKRCLREKGYTLNTIMKRVRDGWKKNKEYRQAFEDGVNLSREMMGNRKSFFPSSDGLQYTDNTAH